MPPIYRTPIGDDMKCRKCDKEAVGLIKKIVVSNKGFIPHIFDIYEGVCEKHMVEEEERLERC